ncbi:MAG: diaminopimelate epimerase [Candidatus Micrarchaeota archaeon]
MKIEFLKYQNCGNDFILVDDLDLGDNRCGQIKEATKKLMIHKYGVGADNVLYLHSSSNADAFMRIYNVSDIEGENCGNGLLCVGKYLCQKLGTDLVLIETLGGISKVEKISANIFKLKLGAISFECQYVKRFFSLSDKGNLEVHIPLGEGKTVFGSVVHAGEPHLVIVDEDLENADLKGLGDIINKNKAVFPLGMNVDLVKVVGENKIRLRTYERSCFEETEACGTGSCCSAFIVIKLGLLNHSLIEVSVNGGKLFVDFSGNDAYLSGEPKLVYAGSLNL